MLSRGTHLGNVVPNPLQQGNLVSQAIVQVTVLLDLSAGQEAVDADTVVKVDLDNVVAGRLYDLGAVVVGTVVLVVPCPLSAPYSGMYITCVCVCVSQG